jgi:phosphoribosylformylglycinamidine synthase
MTFENNIGCIVTVPGDLTSEKLLFSETGGFLVEVADSKIERFKNIFKNHNVRVYQIGKTSEVNDIIINDKIHLNVKEAKNLWLNGLRDKIK